ncbi:MAG: hypothetical protein ONB23_11960 [candidate division KSB1 bacterium]|nr:hypothetical protein [candidate division KSB1 bacterium]
MGTRRSKNRPPITLLELSLLFLAFAVVGVAFGLREQARERARRKAIAEANLSALRAALEAYRNDHGFYPCSPGDANRSADPVLFRRQLTWYTDRTGNVSRVPDSCFRFGPYLPSFPPNPYASRGRREGSMAVWIDTGATSAPDPPKASVGWFYDPRTGEISASAPVAKSTSESLMAEGE